MSNEDDDQRSLPVCHNTNQGARNRANLFFTFFHFFLQIASLYGLKADHETFEKWIFLVKMLWICLKQRFEFDEFPQCLIAQNRPFLASFFKCSVLHTPNPPERFGLNLSIGFELYSERFFKKKVPKSSIEVCSEGLALHTEFLYSILYTFSVYFFSLDSVKAFLFSQDHFFHYGSQFFLDSNFELN